MTKVEYFTDPYEAGYHAGYSEVNSGDITDNPYDMYRNYGDYANWSVGFQDGKFAAECETEEYEQD